MAKRLSVYPCVFVTRRCKKSGAGFPGCVFGLLPILRRRGYGNNKNENFLKKRELIF
jgi:hypothetical protein